MWDIAKKPISVLMDPYFLLFFIYSGSKQSTANRRPDGRVTWLARYSPERHLFGCSIDFVGKFTNNLWRFLFAGDQSISATDRRTLNGWSHVTVASLNVAVFAFFYSSVSGSEGKILE